MKIYIVFFLLVELNAFSQENLNHLGSGGGSKNGFNYSTGQIYSPKKAKTNERLITPGFQQNTLILNPDSLPYYNIGEIPFNSVYQGQKISYFIWSKDLGTKANFNIETKRQPNAKINYVSGKFELIPQKQYIGRDTILFMAFIKADTVFQEVYFDILPFRMPEQNVFGLQTTVEFPDPASDEFVLITMNENETGLFNGETNKKTVNYSIAGKTLIFDTSLKNNLNPFVTIKRSDIKELNLYAETIIIKSQINLPQTNLTIHCKEIRFEDQNGTALFNLKPNVQGKADGSALAGMVGSTLNLNFKNIYSGGSTRFICIGGDGQSTNLDKTPGNGGNGGTIISNFELGCIVENTGGEGGVSSSGTKVGNIGARGLYSVNEKFYSWLHPNALRMILLHSNKAFQNGYYDKITNTLEEYKNLILEYRQSKEWSLLDEIAQYELLQVGHEMTNLLFKIHANLDYFGNPIGWVPMLSFEVNKLAFEAEIPRAVEQLYFSYWVQKSLQNNILKADALRISRNVVQNNILENQIKFDKLTEEIPKIQTSIDDILKQDKIVAEELLDKENKIAERAKYIVKKRHECNLLCKAQKVTGAVGAIASVVPVPWVMGIGVALTVASKIDFTKFSSIKESFGDVVAPFKGEDWENPINDFKKTVSDYNPANVNLDEMRLKNIGGYIKKVGNLGADLYSGVNKLIDNLKNFGGSKAPIDEIETEYERLKAETPDYQEIIEKAQSLTQQKLNLIQDLTSYIKEVGNATESIQSGLISIDALNIDEFNSSSRHSLKAIIYAKELERRAKDRLLRYQYLMAKAYEYRLLMPYPIELDLNFTFEEIKKVVQLDAKVDLSVAQFIRLKSIYEEVLEQITDKILKEYNNNAPSISTAITFKLTTDDIENLNNNIPIRLNLYERGLFLPSQEDIRILEFKAIDTFKTHLTGGQPSSFASVSLNLQHSGLSKLKRNGETYYFNHYNNQNTNPISWKATYDILSKKLQPEQPSISNESMLRVLLEGLSAFNERNIVLYSTPAAWADITITKESNFSGIVLDEVKFELKYEYRNRRTDLINLEIMTNNGMKPIYTISKIDNNGRKDGLGFFDRTYSRSFSQTVAINAPINYGNWKFENWVDNKTSSIISTSNNLIVPQTTDRQIVGNYKLIQPILHTPIDTIKLTRLEGLGKYNVQNIGNGEMNWKVVGSNSWFKLGNDSLGLNTGNFSYTYSLNELVTPRMTHLIVEAGESVDYLDTILVIQSNSSTPIKDGEIIGLKIYPNPLDDILNISFPSTPKFGHFKILNLQGTFIKENNKIGKEVKWDLRDLRSGVYILVIRYEDRIIVRKILKT